jgi:hypothetical protein
MIDPEKQIEHFRQAVELLGGKRDAAIKLNLNERTIRGLCSGERKLHEGYLKDIAAALLAHATACRDMERLLSPAFATNLTDVQLVEPPHGNAYHLRRER